MLADQLGALLQRLGSRPDFRQNPVRALVKRVWWRLRWRFWAGPWLLELPGGPRIFVAQTGAAALIYYQGHSEPATAILLKLLLRPGSVFIDVGAHLGEYTLLAADAVGRGGEVHAFEPNPALAELIARSVELNKFENVVVYPWAVGDSDGEAVLQVMPEASLSYITWMPAGIGTVLKVRCVRLDTWAGDRVRLPDVIKVDVEGAEPLVFRGMESLLRLPPGQAPALVFEYNAPAWRRFGYDPADIYAYLSGCGYRVLGPGAGSAPAPVEATRFISGPPTFDGNLLAVKEGPSKEC